MLSDSNDVRVENLRLCEKIAENDLLKSDDFTRNLKIRISLFVKILFLVLNYTAFGRPLTICRQNLKLTQVFQSRVFR